MALRVMTKIRIPVQVPFISAYFEAVPLQGVVFTSLQLHLSSKDVVQFTFQSHGSFQKLKRASLSRGRFPCSPDLTAAVFKLAFRRKSPRKHVSTTPCIPAKKSASEKHIKSITRDPTIVSCDTLNISFSSGHTKSSILLVFIHF